ncbi:MULTISPECIES: YutD family protein [Lactococcus]|uniref:YutD family protein n=1 Tax=Lactococcus TaxID=1357 RepID=UPI0002D35937|nr:MULTISPECIES: YutD family protein [Lactococcus]QQB45036.1 YutD family protein [Lactococcus garvieae]MBK4109413.1 YutD family protein [Lactococcus petauri]MCR8687654.1 YutD family protein [Lactococcus petauri]MDC0808348.1 YutD family protein [Lactococcus petauri]MDC0812236.1 YutD family protein [Lactococcus petauri]
MPKEVDESKLNYNRFPGERVTATDDIVKVGGKTFHLVYNYREGFDAEKLEQRFSDIFDKYDYIVGDWGFEQLRLKGFFSVSRKKMQSENKIDRLEDYINEYCNYGCAYFVLRRVRSQDESYTSERVFEDKPRQPKFEKARRRNNRNKNRSSQEKQKKNEKKSFEIREKSGKKPAKIKQNEKNEKNTTSKSNFVIRERAKK